MRRTRAGRSPFAPDKAHLHHRLLEIGHSHTRAVLIMYCWTALLAFAFVAVSLWGGPLQVVAVIGAATAVALVVSSVPRLRAAARQSSAEKDARMTAPAPRSAWADRPVKAARTGLLVCLAFVPVAALVGLLAGRAARGRRAPLSAASCRPSSCCSPGPPPSWAPGAPRPPSPAALMASYLVKLVVVAVLLVVLRDVDGADRTALGLSAVVGLLLALVVEARVITSTRAPYVEPVAAPRGPATRAERPDW